MKKVLSVMVVTLLVISFAASAALAQLTYAGASTIGTNVINAVAKDLEAKHKIKFDTVTQGTSKDGWDALVAGKCNIAGIARAVNEEEKKTNPYFQIVAYDAIVLILHDKNAVKDLSKEQVKGIFTGKIANWKEVGGKDAKIMVVTEELKGGSGALKEFKDTFLDGAEPVPGKELKKPVEMVEFLLTDENAITYASMTWVKAGSKSISVNKIEPTRENIKSGDYISVRPLTLVTKETPKDNIKLFFDFILSPEGQAIVGQKLVPVK